MAKVKTVFYCTACGNETPKWMGKCPECGEWNTFIEREEVVVHSTKSVKKPKSDNKIKIDNVCSRLKTCLSSHGVVIN